MAELSVERGAMLNFLSLDPRHSMLFRLFAFLVGHFACKVAYRDERTVHERLGLLINKLFRVEVSHSMSGAV